MSDHDPMTTPDPAHAAAYAELRRRVSAFVREAGPAALDQPAPATPEWRARDVLAHMVGVCDDVTNGRIEGVASDPWTDAQVQSRQDRTVDEMLDEWDRVGPEFEAGLAAVPSIMSGQALFDAVSHEHDLRHALGRPGARDVDAVGLCFEWMVVARGLAGAAALRFDCGNTVVVAGSGEPVATVAADRFELLRAATGRRSASEVASYRWEPPVDEELALMAPLFQLRDEPLDE
jgi:uncharacterized protein (TIGR03083 family)